MRGQEGDALLVVGVVPVDRRVERTCIDEERRLGHALVIRLGGEDLLDALRDVRPAAPARAEGPRTTSAHVRLERLSNQR